jgi:hypothetical protein
MLTSLTSRRKTFIAHVTVDCSSLQSTSSDTRSERMLQIIDWVRSSPEREAIHITLRSAMNNRSGRMLKNTLQALGCQVSTYQPQYACTAAA